MNHSFNVDLATRFGIEEAILIENIAFWIKKNQANNKNIYDGECWTYNSASAFQELFPYMNLKKIQRTLTRLEEQKVLKSGNYNKLKTDKTKWYCIIDLEIKNMYKLATNPVKLPLDKMSNRLDDMSNALSQNVQPIPCINTNINTDKNHDHDSIDIFDNLFKELGINYTKTNQASVKRLLKTMSESEVIAYLKETYKALSENKDIKKLAGAFSKKIAEGTRQVNPKPKKEIEAPVPVEVKTKKNEVATGKRSIKSLGEQDLIDSMSPEEKEHKELEAKVYEVVKSNEVLKKTFYKATMTLEKLKKFIAENNIEL